MYLVLTYKIYSIFTFSILAENGSFNLKVKNLTTVALIKPTLKFISPPLIEYFDSSKLIF